MAHRWCLSPSSGNTQLSDAIDLPSLPGWTTCLSNLKPFGDSLALKKGFSCFNRLPPRVPIWLIVMENLVWASPRSAQKDYFSNVTAALMPFSLCLYLISDGDREWVLDKRGVWAWSYQQRWGSEMGGALLQHCISFSRGSTIYLLVALMSI